MIAALTASCDHTAFLKLGTDRRGKAAGSSPTVGTLPSHAAKAPAATMPTIMCGMPR